MDYLKRTVIFERKDTEVAYEKIDSYIRIYLRKKGTRVFHFQAIVSDWKDLEATILDVLKLIKKFQLIWMRVVLFSHYIVNIVGLWKE